MSAFFITYVSRRSSHEARGVEAFAVFAHVHTDKRIFGTEHLFGEFLGQIGLTYTCRSQEHECADGMIRVFQSYAVALDGLHDFLDGLVLGNDFLLQFFGHILQPQTFLFGHALYGHAAHHGNHFGHFHLGHGLAFLHVTLRPFLL